jgi:hypothetical protein
VFRSGSYSLGLRRGDDVMSRSTGNRPLQDPERKAVSREGKRKMFLLRAQKGRYDHEEVLFLESFFRSFRVCRREACVTCSLLMVLLSSLSLP